MMDVGGSAKECRTGCVMGVQGPGAEHISLADDAQRRTRSLPH
jgi:hypothetical protein